MKKVCEESYVKKVPEEIRELGLLPQTFNFGLKENFIQRYVNAISRLLTYEAQ